MNQEEIRNEIRDMDDDYVKVPDCIMPGLDNFILEWNRLAKKTRKENKEKLFSWVNED